MNKLKTLVTLALWVIILAGAKIYGQAPAINWKKCFGGSNQDQAYSCMQTFDGGYIVAGTTNSPADGDLVGLNTKGGYDALIIKLSNLGNIEWAKRYGGSKKESVTCIKQTADSGFIFCGSTNSSISGNHGIDDCWIVKLNKNGNIEWQKCLGGTNVEKANSVIQTFDGGYMVAGYTVSNDGDVVGYHNTGYTDAWVVKLDSAGNIAWSRCYGGSYGETAYSILQNADSNYVVLSSAQSGDSDVSGHTAGQNDDYWVLVINQIGNILWNKCYGGTETDGPRSIKQTFDGGYIVAGYTFSTNGNVTGNHGAFDFWVLKINSSGGIQWKKCLGGTNNDYGKSIYQTTDSGYVVIGTTYSNDGQVAGNHGNSDIWLVKLSSSGSIKWKRCYGGVGIESVENSSMQQTSDGGYSFCGSSDSTNGQVTGGHGKFDFWLVKLGPSGSREGDVFAEDNSLTVYPNPVTDFVNVEFSGEPDVFIEIYNTLGERVFWKDIDGPKQTLSLGRLPIGFYFIKTKNCTKKIVKE